VQLLAIGTIGSRKLTPLLDELLARLPLLPQADVHISDRGCPPRDLAAERFDIERRNVRRGDRAAGQQAGLLDDRPQCSKVSINVSIIDGGQRALLLRIDIKSAFGRRADRSSR
jgi:hypothetical protein